MHFMVAKMVNALAIHFTRREWHKQNFWARERVKSIITFGFWAISWHYFKGVFSPYSLSLISVQFMCQNPFDMAWTPFLQQKNNNNSNL